MVRFGGWPLDAKWIKGISTPGSPPVAKAGCNNAGFLSFCLIPSSSQ
jgi:hypothetical protein